MSAQMSFEQLLHVSKLGHAEFSHNLLVFEWQEKRQHLAVYVRDLPRLVEEYRKVEKRPYEQNSMITLIDPIPRIRLSSACEAATNCLYGMAEIAAQFANKASGGLLPASFNSLRKKAERGEFTEIGLSEWINDFGWYKKIREIRTEWAHFSTVFTGEENNGDPIVVVRCHRRPSDREEFRQDIQVRIADLIDWINRAISVVDGLGNYVLVHHIIPKLDLKAKIVTPKRDQAGWPIIKADHTFEVEEITIADHLHNAEYISPANSNGTAHVRQQSKLTVDLLIRYRDGSPRRAQ
ncbi:MAG: hypothetical protein KGL01_03745 [Betaproteobacteria bacterium]|nr:hypothetical protein [Betaproteobacteria bacterium]